MTVETIERESRSTTKAEVVETRSGSRRVGGLAAVFGRPSRDLGGFKEVVGTRAFAHAENAGFANVTCTYEHDPCRLLGTINGKTLELRTLAAGLDYTVDLPNTVDGDTVLALAKRGDLRSSFEFQVVQDQWEQRGAMPVRNLIAVRVLSVSPCGNPAYPDASVVALRSLAAQKDMPVEDVLALQAKGELRSLFEPDKDRTYIDMSPTPLDVARRRIDHPDDGVIDAQAAQRKAWLEEHRESPAPALTPQQVWLEMKGREIRYDRMMTQYMRGQQPVYAPTDQQAQHQAQASAVLAEATRRRLNSLQQQGIEIPDTTRGSQSEHGGHQWSVRLPQRRPEINGGWST